MAEEYQVVCADGRTHYTIPPIDSDAARMDLLRLDRIKTPASCGPHRIESRKVSEWRAEE